MTHTAERNLRSKPDLQLFRLLLILGEAVDPGCVDRTRAYDIDANLAVLEFIRPRAGERTHCGFGGAIDAERRHAFDGNNRGIEDNGPAVGHERKGLLHSEEEPLHVGVEGLVEVFFSDLIDGRKFTAPRIGEKSIDAPVLLLNLSVELVEVRKLAGVSLDTGCGGSYFPDGGVKHFLCAGGGDKFFAFFYETVCGRKSRNRGPPR